MEGDAKFAKTPNIGADGKVISYQAKQLVYREYPMSVLVQLVEEVGFTVLRREYFGAFSHRAQRGLARFVKATPLCG